MRRITPHLLLPVLLAAVSAPAAEKIDLARVTPVPAGQVIPIQDFFRPGAVAQPILNRAGTHVAAIASADEDKHFLMVYTIATGKVDSMGFNTAKDIYMIHWQDNERILFQLASQKFWGLGIMGTEIAHLNQIYPVQQNNGASVVSIPLKDPQHPLLWTRFGVEDGRQAGVISVTTQIRNLPVVDMTGPAPSSEALASLRESNIRTTVHTYPMPPEPGITYDYLSDKEGELAYAFTSHRGQLTMFRLEKEKWLPCPVDLETIDIVAAGNQPGQVLVIGPAPENQTRPLQLMDAATGKLGAVLLQDAHHDFNGWTYRDPATGDVLGAVFEKGVPRVYWFNEQYQTLQKALDALFPKQVVQIIGSDDRHEIFLVTTYTDRQPAMYHWVNLAAHKAGLFKNSRPWIDPARMQPMQLVQFKTRDGHRLEGYLTLPAGTSKAKPAPMVVLCHGGPWVRDTWGFDGEVQFLASRGYAVFQPNYRGSTGFVGQFPTADKFDFVKMHEDVTDGVKTVLSTDLIDRTRVAIMGGSFGGYLAISGAAHEPDLYRCAVTIAGVFDWAMQLQAEKFDQYQSPTYGRMVKKLGDPRVETAKYEAMSPLRHAANIRAPIFVAGGKDDYVVQLQQSKRLLDELDRYKVPYEKFFVGGEGHGMSNLDNQVELYGRIEAFLAKYLAPATAP